MIIRHLGHIIVFSETFRPEQIKVDGKEMSMSRHMKNHGWAWKTTAAGNILAYEAEDGSALFIPQKKFMA